MDGTIEELANDYRGEWDSLGRGRPRKPLRTTPAKRTTLAKKVALKRTTVKKAALKRTTLAKKMAKKTTKRTTPAKKATTKIGVKTVPRRTSATATPAQKAAIAAKKAATKPTTPKKTTATKVVKGTTVSAAPTDPLTQAMRGIQSFFEGLFGKWKFQVPKLGQWDDESFPEHYRQDDPYLGNDFDRL